MSKSIPRLARLLSAIVTFAIVCTTLLAGPPPHAYADTQRTTLFRAEFDSAPLGALAGPLAVETGAVVPQGGSVAVAAAPTGRALALDGTGGQATALLQWSNYPNALPILDDDLKELRLDISGDFTASSTTAGTSFGVISGTTFFEFFSFGANGVLTRGGAPIGLTYTPSTTVHLDARITFAVVHGGDDDDDDDHEDVVLQDDDDDDDGDHGAIVVVREVRITLRTASGRVTITTGFPSALSLATLNQLRLQAPTGSGVTTADHLLVQLKAKDDDDDGPPPVIIIRDGDIEQEIENVGGIIFVSIKITIVNTGGVARGTFLVLNLDDLDELFDLADVSFLEGVGFVQRIEGGQVYIGLGQHNVIDAEGKVKVKIKFKAKQNRLDIRVNARFSLNIGDTVIAVPLVVIVVPLSVPPGTTPIGTTPPITPTTGITATVVIQRLALERIDVRFTATWRNRGGLAIFGLPLTEPRTLPNGIVVQYFERARLEWHPELRGTPFEVLLGLLAVEQGYAQPAVPAPTTATEMRWYYPATGHLIAGPFRAYWQSRSGLAIFGLPITEVMIENGRQVQYFERARLELHPELAGTAYEVQIGHLGILALERGD